MKNIFFCLIIGVLFWDLSTGLRISGNDFEDKPLESENPDVSQNEIEHDTANVKLVEDCFVAILGPSVSCILKSLNQWSVTPFDLKFAHNDRNTCCAIWEMTDCMKTNAEVLSKSQLSFLSIIN